jgi:hypothetical protein
MKNKLFTKEEREAIEKVLDMGLTIHNSKDNYLKSNFGDIVICDTDWNEREYKTLSTAITVFLKQENDYHNGL